MIKKLFQNPERLAVICISKLILLLVIAGAIAIMGFKEINRLEGLVEDYGRTIYNYEILIDQLINAPIDEPGVAPVGQYTLASYYDYDLRRTDQKCSTNDCYSMLNATAASRDYERGTDLIVAHGDKSVVVRVNDFGPEYAVFPERGIDLSSYAFAQLAPLSSGVIEVTVEPVDALNQNDQ